jgi:cytochrome oxidase Cu insertion factor (SCO1/SenC/PrrC family)
LTRSRRTLGSALVATLALVAACDGGSHQAEFRLDAAAEAPFRGQKLAEFSLVAHTGRAVHLADVLGQPAVVSFIFTTCTGPCPRVSGQLARVQERLAATPVRLFSFSVDPETDTPEVLANYASSFGARSDRWWFLTGEPSEIDGVLRSASLPALAKNPAAELGMQVTHSTRLIVLDAAGFVRGYYDGESDSGAAAAADRAEWLAVHPGR